MSGLRFRLVLTGAFSTGAPVRVSLADYRRLQGELGEKLADDEWNPDGVPWRGIPSYDEGGGGYSSLVPLVLIQREADGRAPLAAGLQHPDPRLGGWELALEEVRVQMFDLGVGVLAGVYNVEAPAGLAAEEVARVVRARANVTRDGEGRIELPIGASYEQLARDSCDELRSAVAECRNGSLEDPWPSPYSREGEDDAAEWGRLKWLHPVIVLPPERDAGRAQQQGLGAEERLEERARPLRALHSRSIRFDRGLFVPGIKRSVLVLAANDGEDEDLLAPSAPLGLMTMNWAYYALLMDVDRGLLARVDRSAKQRSSSFAEREEEARDAYRFYVRVQEAKARLDSALAGLGPGQVGFWDAIAGVTRFDLLEASVAAKLKALQSVAESRVQEAAAERSRRSRNILTGLTALTLVTLVIAVVEHFVGSRTDDAGHLEVRLLFLGVALLAVIAVYLVAAHGLPSLRLPYRRSQPRLSETPDR